MRARASRSPAILAGALRLLAVVAALATTSVAGACASAPTERASDQTRAGVLAADQGYWEEAEFRWLKALAIDSDNARAINNLAVRFERLGEFDRAKQHYERALQLATAGERYYIEQNYRQFLPVWERLRAEGAEAESEDAGAAAGSAAGEPAAGGATAAGGTRATATPAGQEVEPPEGAGVHALEILIAVPDQGPNLAGYKRILVGPFVQREDSQANLNDFMTRYLRRRITQRTFFQTQDALDHIADTQLRRQDVFEDADYWTGLAAEARADLVLTGAVGMHTRQESQMVRERIRSPDGQIREVARFQDNVVYSVDFDYVVLRGEDGAKLLEGSLQAEQAFPAEEGVAENEAVFETLEELLPDLLEQITPRRSEQSRYLLY